MLHIVKCITYYLAHLHGVSVILPKIYISPLKNNWFEAWSNSSSCNMIIPFRKDSLKGLLQRRGWGGVYTFHPVRHVSIFITCLKPNVKRQDWVLLINYPPPPTHQNAGSVPVLLVAVTDVSTTWGGGPSQSDFDDDSDDDFRSRNTLLQTIRTQNQLYLIFYRVNGFSTIFESIWFRASLGAVSFH